MKSFYLKSFHLLFYLKLFVAHLCTVHLTGHACMYLIKIVDFCCWIFACELLCFLCYGNRKRLMTPYIQYTRVYISTSGIDEQFQSHNFLQIIFFTYCTEEKKIYCESFITICIWKFYIWLLYILLYFEYKIIYARTQYDTRIYNFISFWLHTHFSFIRRTVFLVSAKAFWRYCSCSLLWIYELNFIFDTILSGRF